MPGEPPVGNTGNARLESVRFGRLVDVYGLERTANGLSLALYQGDVVISTDIEDERATGENIPDRDVNYDFLAVDPSTLSSRLFIPREIGTESFQLLFNGLAAGLRDITAARFGQNAAVTPFTVVPRNAALLLTFSQPVGVGDEFFVARDANGQVTGVRNTEAIQLLSIVGDPTDNDPVGDFQPLPARVIPRGRQVVIDPVFLGVEGVQYGVRNNASGMPASGDQLGANVRLAVALEGPLAIPGITEPASSAYIGRNNDALTSVIRDFRSGNEDDTSADLARGFIRDSERPRVVGALPLLMEGVEDVDERNQQIVVYKNTRSHEIDLGDVFRIVDPLSGRTFFTEVSADPIDDAGRPDEQYVRVRVRRVEGLNEVDPRLNPSFPANIRSRAGQDWMRANAPRAVLVCEFTAARFDATSGRVIRDDPANFLVFNPEPGPQIAGYDPFPGEPSRPNVNVSPFAGAIVRFTKPVDLGTVKAFDTFFFAARDVLSEESRLRFLAEFNLTEEQFSQEKYMTPYLVDARVFDETGSQTTLRLQPVKGFYLDEEMRQFLPPEFLEVPRGGTQSVGGTPTTTRGPVSGGLAQGVLAASRLPYYLHLVGGLGGIKDLAGNEIDFQDDVGGSTETLAIPFFLDARKRPSGEPLHEDNLVVSVVRRFAAQDEDPQPSLHRMGTDPAEYQFPLNDIYGGVTVTTGGKLVARPATRVTKIVDNVNQQPPPSQNTVLRWCPLDFSGDGSRSSNSAAVPFGQGIQNPFNPFGARVHMVWRELDMSLSRVDPLDFNLDVEQMYWAPVTTATIFFDIFDETSMYLGHSEFRPEPCVGQFSALPQFGGSGLKPAFAGNYARNMSHEGSGTTIEHQPAPHVAYEGRQFVINPQDTIVEPNGINRFMPLPTFTKPYFTWRDETSVLQGGQTGQGRDNTPTATYRPYILSPFLAGQVVPQVNGPNGIEATNGFWDNRRNFRLSGSATGETFTDGLLGAIALPLLADFQTFCDQPDLPEGNGFVATGFNGWQISLAVTSSPTPSFRSYSGGGNQTCYGPDDPAWESARGQLGVGGTSGDNSVYWTMADFLKRQTVATTGFVEIRNPHRVNDRGPGDLDPRLGPYFQAGLPTTVRPSFEWHFEPPLESLPSGTSIVPEFRAASKVTQSNWADPTNPNSAGQGSGTQHPTFPMNPLCAGDAHLRKYDHRNFGGTPRNYWSHYYTDHVTDYSSVINDLQNETFLNRFAGPNANDNLLPSDVVYFNWRFVMESNTETIPPVSPSVESFSISYRFERVR